MLPYQVYAERTLQATSATISSIRLDCLVRPVQHQRNGFGL